MSDENELILQKIQALQSNFISTLEEKINAILDAKKDIVDNGYSKEKIEILHRLIHTLVGVSAMFGFSSLSEVCFEGDIYLRPFAKENKEFDETYIPELISKTDKINEHFKTLKLN